MSIIERKLVKLFKCCFFRDRCFFTTDDANSFLKHLNTRHKGQEVSCIYCFYQSGETESYEQTECLIDHILTNHGFRLFQCNLCVYRGSSIPHVLLHQANIHGNKYQTTLTGDGMCKVLVCKQIVSGPLPSETVYWSNCKVERIFNDSNELPKYQCLYCDFSSLIPHVVFFHICKVHPDYSLILFDKYVDQLPEIKETEEKTEEVVDDEDAELDAIVRDLHSIGTKDDDVDMAPVDDAPPEDFSGDDDDDDDITQNPPSSSEVTRERLFALKGVRIARKQPEPQASGKGKARKSTSKPIVVPTPSFDRDEEDDVPLTARQRIMRGYRPEQSAALYKPVALTGNSASNRNWLKCLICNDNTKLTKVGIKSHLMLKHNAENSFKCSECTFIGSIREITVHSKEDHGDSTVKYMKFIVALDETEEASIPMLSQPVRSGGSSSTTKIRRKGQDKDPKNLASIIKKSIYIGPKSWKARQKQQRKEMTGQDTDDSESEIEFNQERQEEMDVDMDGTESVVQASGETRELNRTARHRKRKASEMEDVPRGPVSIEELLTLKSSRERESEFFFCLFCSSLSTTNFSEAQAHMKRHLGLNLLTCPECPTFECETVQELKDHNENAHPTKQIPLPNVDENNVHLNYITEFFNEQFLRRRKGDQMNAEQAACYVHIICPICERANQITKDTNYHFTKWRAFKTHFWKHANTSFIKCLKCGALVPRTRKRFHLESKHPEDLNESSYDIKDFTPFYHDSLPELALYSLKGSKRICKASYLSRNKEKYKLKECRVVLRRLPGPEDGEMVKIKEEPIDSIDF